MLEVWKRCVELFVVDETIFQFFCVAHKKYLYVGKMRRRHTMMMRAAGKLRNARWLLRCRVTVGNARLVLVVSRSGLYS